MPAADPPSVALSSIAALVSSATIILTEIPAPTPVPPSSPPSPPPSPSPPLSPPLPSSSPLPEVRLACRFSSIPSKPFSAASVQTLISVRVEKVSSMPSQMVLAIPTVALASVLYWLFASALTAILPLALICASVLITALVLLRITRFRPTEPASENSPVPAPATASAAITFTSSVELSSISWDCMPAVTVTSPDVTFAPLPIDALLSF